MPTSEAPCTHCGAVLPVAAMAQLHHAGSYVYACPSRAVRAPTGRGP